MGVKKVRSPVTPLRWWLLVRDTRGDRRAGGVEDPVYPGAANGSPRAAVDAAGVESVELVEDVGFQRDLEPVAVRGVEAVGIEAADGGAADGEFAGGGYPLGQVVAAVLRDAAVHRRAENGDLED